MSSVKLVNLKKVYPGGVVAVSNFNIDIEDREFIILVGPSGCGKSTTLRMIAGLEEISEGDIYIDGRRVNDVEPKDRDISMVFQNYALYPHMTVFENMSFGLRIRRMPRSEIKRRIDEAAEILEISHLLDRKPAALSGGQRQRVALGRAIVRNPKVFLLDEPLSNLDAKLRTTMRGQLSKLHAGLGTTFIYVTHDQTEAMTMGTRIVIMKDGFVQQIAEPQVLYRRPVNMFVATFIGTPQMNITKALLTGKNGVLRLEFGIQDNKVVIPLPESKNTPAADARLDSDVYFGIRPHDIHLKIDEDDENHYVPFTCKVDYTELMGADKNLFFKLSDASFTAVVDGKYDVASGQELELFFDTDAIHVFDGETEETVA